MSKWIGIRCVNTHRHQMFKQTDGANCVECGAIMTPIILTEKDWNSLPSYSQWKRQQKQNKKNYSAGITNISSTLNYDCSGFHSVTIDIAFVHEGKGFEAIGDAYESLVADIHELLLQSRGSE